MSKKKSGRKRPFRSAVNAPPEAYSGTAIVYATDRSGEILPYPCDFEVSWMHACFPEQLRSRRKAGQQKRRPADQISDRIPDQIDEELLVIVGPAMEPDTVVRALKRLAKNILEWGLMIGPDRDGDEYVFEPCRAKDKPAQDC
jgi:hypothetical protein